MHKICTPRTVLPILFAISLTGCGVEQEEDINNENDGEPRTDCGLQFSDVPDFLSAWVGPRLPLMSVETYSNPIVDPYKIRSMVTIEEFNSEGDMADTFYHEAGIEIRGSFSSYFPKKSYGLELREYSFEDHHHEEEYDVDPHGNRSKDVKASLLGMPEQGDWILYGPHVDKSLMRNMLMYDLSNDIGRYAPRGRFIDLKINGEHQGSYSLFEKIKRDKNRVDIAKLKEDENSGKDLTGGYIIKVDKLKPEPGQTVDDISFPSDYATENNKIHRFSYDYPKPEDITEQQKEYIQNYLHDFENALMSENYKDAELGYRAYIDVDSFIDYFLLTEISHNVDAYRISVFLVKDKSEKLAMGPVWDFNFALGNVMNEFCNGSDWSTWSYQFNSYCPNDDFPVPFWWERLLTDSYFTDKLDERWKALRANVLSDESIINKINSYKTTLEQSGSAEQQFATWDTLNCLIWPNHFVGKTFESEVEYLKEWTLKRVRWMDDNINMTDTF